MADLKKSIGPWSLVAIGAAGIVGSSYLYLSSTLFDSFTLGGVVLGMLLATLLASFVAVGIAELASMFPRAGGEFVYAYVGFGRLPAFIVGWLLIAIYTGIVGFYVTATGRLLATIFPRLETVRLYDIGGGEVYLPVLVIGLALVLGTMALNWFGTDIGFGVQLVLFIVLVSIGAIIAVAGFTQGDPANTQPFFGEDGASSGLVGAVSFVIPALGFLSGFSVVAALAEEANVSRKKLGSLIVASVVIAGVFYAVIFYSTGWIIPWQQTAQLTNGTIEAFQVAGYPAIATLALIAGLVGIVTTVIAVFSSASRLMFALSRAGMLPAFLGRVDAKTGIPRNAVVATTILGIAYGLLGPDALGWILNVGGLYVALVWVFTVVVFYNVRRLYPDSQRPYRVRLALLPAIGGMAGLALTILSLIPSVPIGLTNKYEFALAISMVILGVVLYAASPRNLTEREERAVLLGDTDVDPTPTGEPQPVSSQGETVPQKS